MEDLISKILFRIGDDPSREGLVDTPKRVRKSWDFLFSGYSKKVSDVITTFKNEDEHSQIILISNIEFYSTCEHHMIPFFGKAHVAYIPDKLIIGASKPARILEIYARRLQNQERLGMQVVDALMKHIKPHAAACVLEAQHLCMMARGIEKQNSSLITSSLRGTFLQDSLARSELFQLIKLNK